MYLMLNEEIFKAGHIILQEHFGDNNEAKKRATYKIQLGKRFSLFVQQSNLVINIFKR